MRTSRILIVLLVVVVICWGGMALAKKPGGGGGSNENCRFVPCPACPEGYVLAPPVWPDCCVCVPAP